MIRDLSPRKRIYAGILIFCLISAFIRIALVGFERGRSIVSFVSEWKRDGRPVTAQALQAQDIPVYTKFTLKKDSDKKASGFVTADIKEKLGAGQEVYSSTKGGPIGSISGIGQDLDQDTGMFSVQVDFVEPIVSANDFLVVFARTQTLKDVLVVSNDILDVRGDNYYLWKVENRKAKRVKVNIAQRNGYGSVIANGINPGDLIIRRGRSMLKEEDLVDIVPENDAPQIEMKDKNP